MNTLTGEKWKEILDRSLDGFFLSDAEGRAVYVNQAYCTISGLKPEEILGLKVADFVKNKFIDRSGTVTVLSTKKPLTLDQYFYRTKRRAVVSCNPILDDNDNVVIIVSNIRDMTDVYRLQNQVDQEKEQLERYRAEMDALKQQMSIHGDVIVNDPVSMEALYTASRIAATDSTVLITGESGVGKEEFAKFIHRSSPRQKEHFIRINCSSIAENLFESELFGYEKGAFTGANREGKLGLFEIADRGTLFLDEIGEMPLSIQPKFLRVLQDGEFTRVGGVKPVRADVRIIAATNRNLSEMVKEKRFRDDLYYRLNVIPLKIPPLRERKGDIRPLADFFLQKVNRKYGYEKYFSESTLEAMKEYKWAGNVREMRNLIERAALLSRGDEVQIPEIMPYPDDDFSYSIDAGMGMDLADYLHRVEYRYMKKAYDACGNMRDAAKTLNMSRSTFAGKMRDYRIRYGGG